MKLSIIIPVYNNFELLKKCLDSISKQSFRDYEIIIVDDSERDKRYEKRDGNIFYYKIEHGGAPKARNFGFEKSNGEYVFFCDADVIFLKKDALQKFVNALDNSDAAFAYSKFKFGWKKFPCGEFNIEKLKQNNYISGNSILRRKVFSGWDESLKKFQDWDLWLTIVGKGGKGIFIPEYLWKCKTGGTISSWLPSFFYKLFPKNKKVLEFERVKEIIKKKHGPFV